MKSKTGSFAIVHVLTALAMLTGANSAWAYIGPGAGLSAIGSLLAVVAAIVVGVVGFLWYPIKRMVKKRRATSQSSENAPRSSKSGDEGE